MCSLGTEHTHTGIESLTPSDEVQKWQKHKHSHYLAPGMQPRDKTMISQITTLSVILWSTLAAQAEKKIKIREFRIFMPNTNNKKEKRDHF